MDAKVAFVFPGQGSQRVGMGADLVALHPWLSERFAEADRILGVPLSRYCSEGPASALARTEITQPAVFLTSLAVLDVLGDAGVTPGVVAGHSLGEYGAAVAAGVLDWRDALRLVHRRGTLMAAACARTPGVMAAVLGLPAKDVAALCRQVEEATERVVVVANDNGPLQAVVSGEPGAVHQVMAAARRMGADRVVELDVGGAFHSPLMRDVERRLAVELAGVDAREPQVPLVSNVTARHATSAAEVVSGLRRQVTGAVRWTDTLRLMERDGVTAFVEVGPGRVLTGICRATCPGVPAHATGDVRRLAGTVAALGDGRDRRPPAATAR